jgi:hypothetical protein
MNDEPEKPVTLGLARSRFLDAINNAPDDEDIDPEDAAEELEVQRKELAEAQKQDAANRALGLTDDEREDLFALYRDRQGVINICNGVVAIAFLFGVHGLLKSISVHLANSDGQALFRVLYQPVIWWFLPAFGALCLPWEITVRLWSLFAAPNTIRMYREWARRQSFVYRGGVFQNEFGVYHWFALLIVLPIAVASLMALNMHCNISATGIRDCGYAFRPCQFYSYQDLQSVQYFPASDAGKTHNGSRVVVKFSGRREWDSSGWYGGNDADRQVAAFLLSKDKSSSSSPDASP